MDSLWPMTAPYFPLIIKPRNLAKRQQCKVQWLTPPIWGEKGTDGCELRDGTDRPSFGAAMPSPRSHVHRSKLAWQDLVELVTSIVYTLSLSLEPYTLNRSP